MRSPCSHQNVKKRISLAWNKISEEALKQNAKRKENAGIYD
jgi:hypothetical protein